MWKEQYPSLILLWALWLSCVFHFPYTLIINLPSWDCVSYPGILQGSILTSFPLSICQHSHADLEFITSPPHTIQKYNFEEILISPAYSFLSFSGEEDKMYFVFRVIFYSVYCTRPDDNGTKSAVKQCQKGENMDYVKCVYWRYYQEGCRLNTDLRAGLHKVLAFCLNFSAPSTIFSHTTG